MASSPGCTGRSSVAPACGAGSSRPRGSFEGPSAERASSEPAASALLELLLDDPPQLSLSGGEQPTDATALALRERRLRERPVSGALVARLVAFLSHRPDEDVSSIPVLRLADRWKVPRRELLRLFLHATDVGLLELHWSLRCPACRVPAGRAASLGEVPEEIRCPGCGLAFGPDLSFHVEASFSIHPALRRVQSLVYCTAGTAGRPHVFAQIVLGPRQSQRVVAPLPAGELLVRSVYGPGSLLLSPPHPRALSIVLRPEGLALEPGDPANVPEGETGLSFRSEVDGPPAVVVVERVGWEADWVSAATLTTVPEFHSLFAGEAPHSRSEISVGRITLLFSDLQGSTALYQRLGDPRAFSLVEGHFERLERVVDECDGALVKTMGDAVMAAFASSAQAVRAALAMHETIARSEAGIAGLKLKVGIHTGTCLAVRANGRLDFFGNAVNLAARAQAQSKGGDVVVTEAVLQDPEVTRLLEGLAREPFEARLKGIDLPQRLWRVQATPTP